ncbi:hypothetical protein Daus18300_004037 [Diaporthe australafricana]|uniref:Uracil catabolism protein 4 n=1 Tax=Diaporthe australafricana TaxID=127596 RepID=A0ABR3XBZ7_9PEZI
MGLFSRKDKSTRGITSKPSLTTVQSQVSLDSGSSSIKSPAGTFSSRAMNRSSAGTNNTSAPNTPLSPFSPQVPKIDMPKPPDPDLDPAGYLRNLASVRERCRVITTKAVKNELRHFDVDMRKFPEVVSFVASIVRRDYDAPFTSIPAHGRHQHFCVGGRDRIAHLLSTWENVESTEKCRRLIDLFLVSVLLDAGAGTQWSYKSTENGRIYRRSEGIAVASLEMFKTGMFSGDKASKYQVDKEGLRNLTVEQMAKGLQSKPGNEMAGLQGRTELLIRLADALDSNKEFFGENGRPGNMLAAWESILPFHKLTQWLTYSLMQPMQQLMKIHFAGQELLTGLPEYRNGGLFVDLGVLTLKPEDMERGLQHYKEYCARTGDPGIEVAPMFEPSDDLVVEWRGVTVGLLDRLCVEVNHSLKAELAGNELSLPQVLEAGSWKGGREIAEINRPNTKEPPILIDSDGTVF